jgi:hypothetical protein
MQKPLTQLLLAQLALLWQISPFLNLQEPIPSHVPDIVHVVSSVYNGKFVQEPSEPVTLHPRHVVAHAVLQQTPSTQKPLKHSLFVPQIDPLALRQTPAPSH